MAGALEGSIVDLFLPVTLDTENVRAIAQKLNSNRLSVAASLELNDEELDQLLREGLPEGLKFGLKAAIRVRKRALEKERLTHEREPLSKKPKRRLVSAEEEYWEKLLEPLADLPETPAQLQEVLVQTPVKLPVHEAFYDKVGSSKLLTHECPEEVARFATMVESAFQTMDNVGVMNEATSSANLYQISGQFIKKLNDMAPLGRRLKNVYIILDSPNPNSTQTASQPLQRLARPDFQLFVKGCLILRWENKVGYQSFPEAVRENSEKLKAWSPLFYGALPYVIGGCCAENQFRWLRLRPDDKETTGALERSRQVEFVSSKGEREWCNVTIYPHVVKKVIEEDDGGMRPSLYTAIKHSKYLIHGEVRRLKKTTVLTLEPVGDPDSEPVTLKELENATHDILRGLNDLHKAGYTHRDVRWENCIKVNVKGEWKWILIDLEAAGADGEEWNHREPFRAWGSHTLEGRKNKYTKASDLYLLGKLMCGWLVGKSLVDEKRNQVMKARAEKMMEKALPAAEVKKLFCKRSCKRCRTFGNDS